MLSAFCFNLDQSKILLSGNGLTFYPTIPVETLFPNKPLFLCVCKTSLLKTLRGKGEVARYECFLPFGDLSACFIKEIVV